MTRPIRLYVNILPAARPAGTPRIEKFLRAGDTAVYVIAIFAAVGLATLFIFNLCPHYPIPLPETAGAASKASDDSSSVASPAPAAKYPLHVNGRVIIGPTGEWMSEEFWQRQQEWEKKNGPRLRRELEEMNRKVNQSKGDGK